MIAIKSHFSALKKSIKYYLKYFKSKLSDNKINNQRFLKTSSFLTHFQFASSDEIRTYQLEKLKKLIEYSYKDVPYYTELFSSNDLNPDDIRSLKDLERIPFLTKDIIRNNFNHLVSKSFDKCNITYNKTGGTTGDPLEFVTEKDSVAERAFVKRYFDWGDYDNEELLLVLRGKKFHNTGTENWWWKFDPFENALYVSSYHLPYLETKAVSALLNKYRPEYIQGYPSSVFQLAKKFNDDALEIDFIKSVFTSSETLYQEQRKFIEMVFNARVFDLYGHRERVAMIHQCEMGSYHIIPEYGIVELCKPKYDNEEGALEIVATGFCNYAMPFIRYRTGDLAIPDKKHCECGRNHQLVKKIIGREQDYFVNKNGIKIPLISHRAYSMIYKISSNIKEFKYHQKIEGVVTIMIVPEKDFTKKEEELIKEQYAKQIKEIEFKIKTVDEIEKTGIGKLKIMDQYIK